MFYTLLPQRSFISLSGCDTIEFLQSLISNDARLLSSGSPIYSALLSPHGKFLHDFFLIPWQEKIFIDVSVDRVKDLLMRLKIYRLRSNVEIEMAESIVAAAFWGSELNQAENSDYKIYGDPRLPTLGFRAIGKKSAINDFCEQHSYALKPHGAYENLRLSLGVPDTWDMIAEKSLLLEFGFEELHGVSFSKGCYIGQETTARSKFRGQVRKSIYKAVANTALPSAGTPIIVGEKTIGEMRTSLGNIGIALLYNEEYENAKNNNLAFLCDGIAVHFELVEWLKNFK